MENHDDDRKSLRSARPWLAVSVLIGTSLAIAVPALMFRKAKSSALQTALKDSSSAPPRRAFAPNSTMHTLRHRRLRPIPVSTSNVHPQQSTSTTDFDSPSTGQLLSAVSKTDVNTALLAGKALFIATCIVGFSACGAVYAVQKLMGVDNVPDFAQRMRSWTNTYLSGITTRIYRAPKDGENREVEDGLTSLEYEDWTQEAAEKRVRRAYEEGGLPLWFKVAWRETEAELALVRAQRQRQKDAAARQNSDP